MIFKVSKEYKGSCMLPTLGKVVWANVTVSISEEDLRADDIRVAVKKGILVPVDEEYNEEALMDKDVIIVNNSDTPLVVGSVTLRPNGSLPISKETAQSAEIITAGRDGIITILSDESLSDEEDDSDYVKVKEPAKAKKKAKKTSAPEPPKSGEDKDPTAKTWNFQTKKAEDAVKIEKSTEFTNLDEEAEDVEFIDAKKSKAKKKAKKKTKKASNNKKKVKSKKRRKVKELTPVGEKKVPKTEMDAMIELDSRGNSIGEKPGDVLAHLIDSIGAPEDINFVDGEQDKSRQENRTDME